MGVAGRGEDIDEVEDEALWKDAKEWVAQT
jgi:hypothetical protein